MHIDHALLVTPVDIFRTLARADRIRFLMILISGRCSVSELADTVYGIRRTRSIASQTSAALAPMRRLGLIRSIRDGRHIYYELTELGHKVIGFIDLINCHEPYEDS